MKKPKVAAAPIPTIAETVAQVCSAAGFRVEVAEYNAKSAKDAVRGHLDSAIGTMRRFLDDAERSIGRHLERDDLDRAVACLLHELAWGQANASSSVENAMSCAAEYAVCAAKLRVLQTAAVIE